MTRLGRSTEMAMVVKRLQMAKVAQRRQIHHRLCRSVSTELPIGPTGVAGLLPRPKQGVAAKEASMFIVAYSIFILARTRWYSSHAWHPSCRAHLEPHAPKNGSPDLRPTMARKNVGTRLRQLKRTSAGTPTIRIDTS